MREIKFRAWDMEQRELAYNGGYGVVGLYERLDTTGLNITIQRMSKRFVLMQYTGLKDKNGVEIYEGDILKSEYEDELKLVEPLSCGRYLAFFDYGDFIDPEDNDEVIGNIWENKELLK